MSVDNCFSITSRGMPAGYGWKSAMIRHSAYREEFSVGAVFIRKRNETGNMACGSRHS